MKCANCGRDMDMTDRVWFRGSVVCCTEFCARELPEWVKNLVEARHG